MSKRFDVKSSTRCDHDGETTSIISVEIAENGETKNGPIMIECPSDFVPDLSCALQIVVQAIEELDLELIEPCPKH